MVALLNHFQRQLRMSQTFWRVNNLISLMGARGLYALISVRIWQKASLNKRNCILGGFDRNGLRLLVGLRNWEYNKIVYPVQLHHKQGWQRTSESKRDVHFAFIQLPVDKGLMVKPTITSLYAVRGIPTVCRCGIWHPRCRVRSSHSSVCVL